MSAYTFLSVLPSPQSVVSEWNLAEDFLTAPNQLNPNPDAYGRSNVWYYLRSTSLSHIPESYDLLSEYDSDNDFAYENFGVHNVQHWRDNGYLPSIGINASGTDILINQPGWRVWDWPNGTINLHPTYDQYAIVGWKAPLSGEFDVEGFFRDIDSSYGDGVRWFIDKGSQTIASGQVGEVFPDNSQSFSFSDLYMNQGDFLYFIVDINESIWCDSTELSLLIQSDNSDNVVFNSVTNMEGKYLGSLVYDFSKIADNQILTSTVDDSALQQTNAFFHNLIGLYQVENNTGAILDTFDSNGNGQTDDLLNPGDRGYSFTAISNRVNNFTLQLGDSGNLNSNTTAQQFGNLVLNGNKLYAPFVIANGGDLIPVNGIIDDGFGAFLEENPNNIGAIFDNFVTHSVAYFTFGMANPDETEHLENRGNSIFGFEDLPGNLGVSDFDCRFAHFWGRVGINQVCTGNS